MDIYPSLTYRDIEAALDQLETAFGLERVIMDAGDGGRIRAAAVRHRGGMVMVQPELPGELHGAHAGQGWVYVVVDDADAHHARARQAGAEVLGEPHDAFGGRQRGYSARDREGNLWSFGTSRPEEEPVAAADRVELARRIIAAGRYLTLATADASGRPWVSPVFFAPGRPGEFLWVSRPGSEHSRNLAVRPEVSVAIFDSRQALGVGQGVYGSGRAELADPAEIEVFSRASERWGGRPWTRADVEGDAELRLYRAVATEISVMDSGNDPRGDRRSSVAF